MNKKPTMEIIQQKVGIQNPVNVFLVSKRPGTRETYAFCLDKIARKLGVVDAYSFNWAALRYEHVTMIAAWMSKNHSSTYTQKVMAAVRGLLRTCRVMRLMTADDYESAVEGCKVRTDAVPRQAAGRMLSPAEIQAFLRTCRVGPRRRAIRDAAIFMLMVGCGLRVGEPGKLKYEEFDQSSGKLMVHGKGRKTRTVYCLGDVRLAMEEWLRIRGSEPGPLLLTIVKSDQVHPTRVEVHAIWQMLKDRQRAAGIKPFTPHDCRRTLISNLLEAGVDLATVADMAGHRSPNVTMGYDRRGEERKARAAIMVRIPFEARGEI